MRFVSLLLLSVLLSVFIGTALPFAAEAAVESPCCAGESEPGEDKEGTSSPCRTSECPCGFCLPAVLPAEISVLPPDLPGSSSPISRFSVYSDAIPRSIDYPPENQPA